MRWTEDELKQNQNQHCVEQNRAAGEREEVRDFWDGFEPDSKHFSRDRSSSKFLGKLYKLSNIFNRLKIELEIVIGYDF